MEGTIRHVTNASARLAAVMKFFGLVAKLVSPRRRRVRSGRERGRSRLLPVID
jgi:hypothetical protein